MKPLAIFLCVFSQLFLVAGQLLFRRAMDTRRPKSRRVQTWLLVLGIATQTVWFFLWLGLLQNWPLSKIFPYEGLNPVLVVIAAVILLKERLTPESLVAAALIGIGLAFVTGS